MPPEVDFDRLLASLKDLSELVVDNDTQVTPMPSGTRLHVLEPIPLKLYRNGIMMFDGPFRPFYDPSTQVGSGGEGRETGLCTLRPLLCYLLCSPLVGAHPAHRWPILPPTGTQTHAELAESPPPPLVPSPGPA